jgi:hypothetical protein
MPRTPARFTQADVNRAAKVAVSLGLRVRVTKAGDIVLEQNQYKTPPQDDQLDTMDGVVM